MSSLTKAAMWMAGWLACKLVMAVAGRETTRELSVFQTSNLTPRCCRLASLPR